MGPYAASGKVWACTGEAHAQMKFPSVDRRPPLDWISTLFRLVAHTAGLLRPTFPIWRREGSGRDRSPSMSKGRPYNTAVLIPAPQQITGALPETSLFLYT